MKENTNEVKSIPSFAVPIKLLGRYGKARGSEMTPKQTSIINEIRRRLERLDKLSPRLIWINNELIKRDRLIPRVDLENENVVIDFGGKKHTLKLKRKDPNVPIELKGGTMVSGYSVGSGEKSTDQAVFQLQEELEEKLESFYQNSHKVINLIKFLPGFRKFKCDAITIVRNKLVEHTEDRHIYSFGYGSNGPVVKPTRPVGASGFHDRGFVENSRTLIDALKSKLENAIANA